MARTVSSLVLLLAVAPRLAAAPPETPACPADVQARLEFLEERLDERRVWADRWWKFWTTTYGLGVVVQSVRAGIEDDDGEQADFVVSAVKALSGTARLLWSPPAARVGADPMRAIAADDAAGCAARLAAGEEQLRAAAHDSESRWSWKRHLANVATNVAGGVIVAEGWDESDGWVSAGTGIAVGEVQTWSHPWHADDDLAEYEQRFGLAHGARASWHVAAWGRGLRVGVRF